MFKKFLYISAGLLFFVCNFRGQKSDNKLSGVEDSILKIIAKEKQDTIKAAHYNYLAAQLRRNDPQKAIKYGNSALQIYEKLNITGGMAQSHLAIGTAYMNLSQHYEALDHFKKAVKYGEKAGDKKVLARIYNNTGIVFIKQDNTPEAIKNYLMALKLRQELNDKAEIGSSYLNIGNVYYKVNNFKEALKNYKLANELFENADNKFGLANTISNIGNIYEQMGKVDSALYFYNKSLDINIEMKDKRGISSSYNHIGSVYSVQKKYTQAKEYFANALKIEIETENYDGISETTKNIADADIRLNNYAEAEKNLIQNITLLKKIRSLSVLSDSYLLLSHVDTIKKDFKKSLYHYKMYILYRDSVLNKENSEKIVQQQLTFEFNQKESESRQEQLKKDLIAGEELRRQKTIAYTSTGAGILILLFLAISIKAYKAKQKANQIITKQKSEVESQKHLLDIKQKEILDSIHYAKRIQNTILPHHDLIAEHLPDNFIFYKPKDIVSGDFYWATVHNEIFYLAVCDSTGHGVPGAFMSILNIGFLSEAINEKNISQPNEILNYVRERLINSISKDGQQDGFDGILIRMDKKENVISYAASNNAPALIRNNELIELPKDKMPVGKGMKTESFSLHQIPLQNNDCIYLYTDGYADQFGGTKGKKFMYKNLHELLLSSHDLTFHDQKNILSEKFDLWKGSHEQVDDVCVIGIKIRTK